MTDPKETNEEINKELSNEELKSVSGGMRPTQFIDAMTSSNPQGSGSGKTLKDWEKSKKTGLVRGHLDY